LSFPRTSAEEAAARQTREKDERIGRFLKDAYDRFGPGGSGAIAPIYWKARWPDYRVSPRNRAAVLDARAFAGLWRQSPVPGAARRLLWLQGRSGVGKTMLAHVVARAILEELATVGFLRAVDLVEQARARSTGPTSYEVALKRARVVCLDDLGKEPTSGYKGEEFQSLLFDLVDTLYRTPNRGLIVTTELDPGKLHERYPRMGAALNWRLAAMHRREEVRPIYASDEEGE